MSKSTKPSGRTPKHIPKMPKPTLSRPKTNPQPSPNQPQHPKRTPSLPFHTGRSRDWTILYADIYIYIYVSYIYTHHAQLVWVCVCCTRREVTLLNDRLIRSAKFAVDGVGSPILVHQAAGFCDGLCLMPIPIREGFGELVGGL